MTAWPPEELDRIAAADELELSARGADGTPREPVTVWVVRHGDDLFVRSAYGPEAAWFRGTRARQEGSVSAGGVEKEVAFVATNDLDDEIDAAYTDKYGRYGDRFIRQMTSPEVRATTLRLDPGAVGTESAR
jgi:hypothetical protein